MLFDPYLRAQLEESRADRWFLFFTGDVAFALLALVLGLSFVQRMTIQRVRPPEIGYLLAPPRVVEPLILEPRPAVGCGGDEVWYGGEN